MAKELLIDAVQYIKAGKKKEALPLLSRYVALNPDDENGWSWLYACVDTEERKIYCLKQILRINPQHQKAQLALKKLEDRNISSTSVERITLAKKENESSESQISSITAPDNPIPIIGQKHQTIEFIPAICPNCGGELRVPKTMDLIKCMYCGKDIIIQNPNQFELKIQVDRNVPKLYDLASKSEEAHNYNQSSIYFSQILEVDPENRNAWLGKARAAAQVNSINSTGLEEAISYIKTAIELDNSVNKDLSRTILTLAKCTCDFAQLIYDDFEEELNRKNPLNNPAIIDPLAINLNRLLRNLNEKYQKRFPPIHNSLSFCWKVLPSRDTAQWINQCLNKVLQARELGDETKDWVIHNLASISEEIQRKYAELEKPKKKGCFIATATIGNENHPMIYILKEYRDKVLLKSTIGRIFIRQYYRISPLVSPIIANHIMLKKLSFWVIVKPAFKHSLKVLTKIKQQSFIN